MRSSRPAMEELQTSIPALATLEWITVYGSEGRWAFSACRSLPSAVGEDDPFVAKAMNQVLSDQKWPVEEWIAVVGGWLERG